MLTLSPSTTCINTFAGTISDPRINGSYFPDPCPLGTAGVWDLARVR